MTAADIDRDQPPTDRDREHVARTNRPPPSQTRAILPASPRFGKRLYAANSLRPQFRRRYRLPPWMMRFKIIAQNRIAKPAKMP